MIYVKTKVKAFALCATLAVLAVGVPSVGQTQGAVAQQDNTSRLAVPCGEEGVKDFADRHFVSPEELWVVPLNLNTGGNEYGVGFVVGELECSGWVVFGQACEALRFEQQCSTVRKSGAHAQ